METPDYTCPYCGACYEECYDDWEDVVYLEGSIEVECYECERTFLVERSFAFYYESSPIELNENRF